MLHDAFHSCHVAAAAAAAAEIDVPFEGGRACEALEHDSLGGHAHRKLLFRLPREVELRRLSLRNLEVEVRAAITNCA